MENQHQHTHTHTRAHTHTPALCGLVVSGPLALVVASGDPVPGIEKHILCAFLCHGVDTPKSRAFMFLLAARAPVAASATSSVGAVVRRQHRRAHVRRAAPGAVADGCGQRPGAGPYCSCSPAASVVDARRDPPPRTPPKPPPTPGMTTAPSSLSCFFMLSSQSKRVPFKLKQPSGRNADDLLHELHRSSIASCFPLALFGAVQQMELAWWLPGCHTFRSGEHFSVW